MPCPRGHDCGMHVGLLSKPEETMPMSLHPAQPATPQIFEMDLFQRMVLLTEAMNKLKQCVNEEKAARDMNPSHLEEVSSDKEELEVPIASVITHQFSTE